MNQPADKPLVADPLLWAVMLLGCFIVVTERFLSLSTAAFLVCVSAFVVLLTAWYFAKRRRR